jgi:hypothetical protein
MARPFALTSSRQHEEQLRNPALCDELRIRDILDSVAVMTSGVFVAAYELQGLHSYYHTDEMRNRAKESIEAAIRSVPERSMRLRSKHESGVSSYRRAQVLSIAGEGKHWRILRLSASFDAPLGYCRSLCGAGS